MTRTVVGAWLLGLAIACETAARGGTNTRAGAAGVAGGPEIGVGIGRRGPLGGARSLVVDGLAVSVPVGAGDDLAVGVGDGVAVVDVGVGAGDGVTVDVGVGAGDGDAVGVPEGAGDGEAIGVTEGAGGEGLAGDALAGSMTARVEAVTAGPGWTLTYDPAILACKAPAEAVPAPADQAIAAALAAAIAPSRAKALRRRMQRWVLPAPRRSRGRSCVSAGCTVSPGQSGGAGRVPQPTSVRPFY